LKNWSISLRKILIRAAAAALALVLSCTGLSMAVTITITNTENETVSSMVAETAVNPEAAAVTGASTDTGTDAREAFISAIVDTARTLYEKANGRLQRAQYAGDIYVCKNFTVYLFTQNAGRFRMAEYPDVALKIPNNLPADECVDFAYGQVWEDVAASQGNPFYAAAEFRYDGNLTMAENEEIARQFMTQVRRGDYFQMSAEYYYGTGAHSLVFIADYDPENGTVRWTDSNMKGEKRDGIRYGLVQYDAVKDIDWFVDAFCHDKRGATLYRLRDDIITANQEE
jgi:hypothetical protein